MFEHRQNQVNALLESNQNFRRLYEQHQQLEQRLEHASNGKIAMNELSLNALKKQKLQAKDELNHLLRQQSSTQH